MADQFIRYPAVSLTSSSFPLTAPDGSASAPSYSNSTGKTGLYFGSGEALSLSTNQTQHFSITSAGAITIGAAADTVGFYGATPAAKASAYTVSNATPSRSLNVSTVTLTQLANNVAQLIADLQALGLVG